MKNQTNRNTTSKQSKATAETATVANEALGSMSEETAEVISNVTTLSPGGTRKSLMASVANENAVAASMKVQSLQRAKQHLAEAFDLYGASDDKIGEAKECSAKGALLLYQARTSGTLSNEEVNASLGDVFGYKAKRDGTPGKTPDGQGEAIRKRIVRASQAHDYVTGKDATAFFDGLPEDDVRSVVDGLLEGNIPFWQAYEMFADIRKEHLVRVEPAFDPKRIAALADALSNDIATSADMFVTNPALLAAYTALVGIIGTVDTAAANIAEADKKAA